MDNITKDLVAIVLQHLNENNFHEAARTLEQESGIFVNLEHVEKKVVDGEWNELETYLLGFTKIDDNIYSEKMFFEIRQQKYLEALNRNEKAKAHHILVNDLAVFSFYQDQDILSKEICRLMTLNDYREHEKLREFVSVQTSRNQLVITIEDLIGANPKFHQKYDFPSLDSARLINMISQSHNMQHTLCENPRELPKVETLFNDHECEALSGAMASTSADIPSRDVKNCNANISFGVDSNDVDPTAVVAADVAEADEEMLEADGEENNEEGGGEEKVNE